MPIRLRGGGIHRRCIGLGVHQSGMAKVSAFVATVNFVRRKTTPTFRPASCRKGNPHKAICLQQLEPKLLFTAI